MSWFPLDFLHFVVDLHPQSNCVGLSRKFCIFSCHFNSNLDIFLNYTCEFSRNFTNFHFQQWCFSADFHHFAVDLHLQSKCVGLSNKFCIFSCHLNLNWWNFFPGKFSNFLSTFANFYCQMPLLFSFFSPFSILQSNRVDFPIKFCIFSCRFNTNSRNFLPSKILKFSNCHFQRSVFRGSFSRFWPWFAC